jgi:beta-hydroxylase
MLSDRAEQLSWYAAKRAGMRLGRKLLDECGRELAQHSPLGDRPVFSSQVFPWANTLEAHWREIRAELLQVLAHRNSIPNFQDVSPDQAHLAQGDQWKTFFLMAYGYRAPANCARCPVTTRLAQAIPGVTTAFFSILAPHTHVPPHRGVYKGVLRYHLGLLVPEPERCRIRVDDQMLRWREGESLVFDDTFEHEVWNDSDLDRAVLFLDVLRPLNWPWSLGNQMFVKAVSLSPLVQDGLANFERLNEQLAGHMAQ